MMKKILVFSDGFDNSLLPSDKEVLGMMSKYKNINKSEYDKLDKKDRLEVYSKQRILYFMIGDTK